MPSIQEKKQDLLVLNGKELEEVNNFKYLGLIIQSNGKFAKTMEDRIDKALKCSYVLRNAISHHHNISTTLAMSLFNKQIAPVLLYGCSVWAAPEINAYLNIKVNKLDWFANKQAEQLLYRLMNRYIDIEKSVIYRDENRILLKLKSWEDKLEILQQSARNPITFLIADHDIKCSENLSFEKVQTKFIKFALGVPKTTSTSACLRELGEYPVSIRAYTQCVMYYHRLEAISNENSDSFILLNSAYNTMKEYKHPWLNSIHYILAKNGMDDVYRDMSNLRSNYVKNSVKMRLCSIYEQDNHAKLSEKSYLRLLAKCTDTTEYKTQPYLKLITSPSIREVFTKIRTNSSKLSNKPYEESDSRCDTCNVMLDIEHMLIKCPKNQVHRNEYYNHMKDVCNHFELLSDSNKVATMLNMQFNTSQIDIASTAVKLTISFVYKSYLAFVNKNP